MANLSLIRERNHAAANDVGHSEANCEAMRSWVDMLRKEALSLRSEAFRERKATWLGEDDRPVAA